LVVKNPAAQNVRATTTPEQNRKIVRRVMMEGVNEHELMAFPDWHEKIELMIAEGDKVAYITTGTGTHAGPMGDIPPTGKPIEITNYTIHRIENGKIAETWIGWDNLAALVQMGLFPPPGAGKDHAG
jgi:predicted ester cyclase